MRFIVPGIPVPKARPRFFGGHAVTTARTKEYEQRVALYAANALAHAEMKILDGAIEMEVWFYLPNRRSDPDIDNLIKAALDGCNGVLYKDDRQVMHLEGWKSYDKAYPRTVIVVKLER